MRRIVVHAHVSGRDSVKVTIFRSAKIRTLVARALVEVGILNTTIPEWEVRNIRGGALDHEYTLREADVIGRDNVYISPRPGVGA